MKRRSKKLVTSAVQVRSTGSLLAAFKEKEGAAAPITFKVDASGKPGFDTYKAAMFVSAFGIL